MTKKNKNSKLNTIQFTMQEIWEAMKPNVYKNKKHYTRKNKHKNKKIMKNYIKWTPVLIALTALFYSVGLGLEGHTEEALYSSHWPATMLLFYLVIDKIKG